jgi:pyruvate/2-oxoglutarate dehydrogenase complex dihydrolipoamide dehydrogenase (E3) component
MSYRRYNPVVPALSVTSTPSNLTDGKMTDNHDVIIIGAGATGENVADRTQKGGLSTVIIESELGSGECSYCACMPTKALLQAREGMREAKRTHVSVVR